MARRGPNMTRSRRLLELIAILRAHRYPVRGADLADQLGISLRTLYRDIATLQEQGADIAGEPGLGYVLQPGFILPPLMFTPDEIEALVLGSSWVGARVEGDLGRAAMTALTKIRAVLPDDLQRKSSDSGLMVAPSLFPNAVPQDLMDALRQLIRREHRARLEYQDQHEVVSERIIWPIALTFFESARVVVAYCELRQDFRHFRLDRIVDLSGLDQRYPKRRSDLVKDWRARHFS